ncbi:Bug family tripartite tricarboxylate transporter substrate binding protein [Cupriavidus taiwanensis]|uniref:Bug family tripartite tricarboxylate transporter substrate binding protein n=1 Tax=Cupriavidus taiwanensis TaxID=164546 RepID=UPI000E103F12|nr:tripartite tricarboxylate transporter substrate binding protein [Cupriavidus taiwanensis]SOY42812.1 MFS transporter [Cupriavidus taiwanensis]SOY58915.1 MFS transporter [Cupriavidus taiwanensis]SOY80148.1 MFS transporter [Cupriavidus taiwanensis]SOZ50983.1 MFS transporter [Cupriavidus taiwanensis]SOZ76044.1 MFS transporter [Cupriavidus taiwanensis]
MQSTKRLFLRGLAIAAALTTTSVLAAYPEKRIALVVPTAAGGANDAMARVVGQAMSSILKQTVVVDNKAGANGAIASEFVMRAPADGYTLLLGYVATHAMNPALQTLRYDPIKDFVPVGMVGSSATVMVVNPSLKAADAKAVVALLKAAPGKLSYASAGNGTAPHFAAEMFKISTGTNMLHVPYKGSAPAINDTVAGQTQVMFPSLFTALPQLKNGKLKAVGIAGSKRSALMPEVPTLKEQGINDVDVSQWYAIFAPANTPAPVVETLNKALNQALADKTVVQRLEGQGAEVTTMTTSQMRTFMQQEQIKWKAVVQAAKLKAD